MTASRPRIAVAAGYMPFFDEIMPAGYRADRDAYGRSVADVADAVGDVTYLGLMHDEASGRAAGEALAALGAHAILLAPTMATPANYLWSVVESNPGVPVVIWAAYETGTIAPTYDMVELCRHSQNVGALMVGNMLARAGRPFAVVAGERDDAATRTDLRDTLAVAALAGRLKRSRIGRLGRPLDGYANVDVDAAALKAATGIELVEIELDEWNETLASTSPHAAEALVDKLRQHAELDDRGQPQAMLAAARMAAALEETAQRHGLCAGAMNCRGAFGVTNSICPSLGCLATTHATSIGIPFACTGDVITAIAMAIGRTLGGASLYCELDAIDTGRDAFLCANTGEGDFGWSKDRTASCRIFTSGMDSGRYAPGCSVRQGLRAGPATMVGFTPRADATGGFALIAMEGEVQEQPEIELSVSSAWFRADTQPMRRAFARWAEAGATHHGSLSPGRQASRLELLARFLGIGFEQV
ncbi:hypothetical protein [Arvimicrobium flavum]|uniref:hypothetical protein n=1 Tax=Arvimicrobium flavum TaxID=3393320 RepID=UPI00237A4095|nr:hypothetical protein [Mesorhizobium shangrilense]